MFDIFHGGILIGGKSLQVFLSLQTFAQERAISVDILKDKGAVSL